MKTVNEPDVIEMNGHEYRVVQDPEEIAEALKNGETVYHWEFGDSMSPMLRNLEYCRITPLFHGEEVKPGEAVFCKIKDRTGQEYYMVHQVWQVADFGYDHKKWYKIGSTMGTIFGWSCEVLGKAYGTDIFQEYTPEMRAALESEWENSKNYS